MDDRPTPFVMPGEPECVVRVCDSSIYRVLPKIGSNSHRSNANIKEIFIFQTDITLL